MLYNNESFGQLKCRLGKFSNIFTLQSVVLRVYFFFLFLARNDLILAMANLAHATYHQHHRHLILGEKGSRYNMVAIFARARQF